MPRENPHRPFHPDPEQVDCAPEVSGNAVNGLGETALQLLIASLLITPLRDITGVR